MSTYAESLRADFKAYPLGTILGSVTAINPTSVRQTAELSRMGTWSFEIAMAAYDDTFMQTGYYVEFHSVIDGVDTAEFSGWITAFDDTWSLPTVAVNTIQISGKDDLFELAKTTIRFGEIYTPMVVYPLYVGWTQGPFGEGDTNEFTSVVTDNDTGTYERFGMFDISTAPSDKQSMFYIGNDAPFTKAIFTLGAEVNSEPCTLNVQICHLSLTEGKAFLPPTSGLTNTVTSGGVPFAQSGYIEWDKEALEIQETHDGKALYWMRFYMDGFIFPTANTTNIRFAEVKVEAAGPHANDVQEIIDNYAPSGWGLHASSETGTQESFAVNLFNETVLGALFDLTERSGELFALTGSQELRWINPAALPSSGITAVQSTTDGSGSAYCYLRGLTRHREYKDIVTRVYPTGAGDDEVAAVTLSDLELDPATADWRFDLPTGWTIDPTENYIANTPLETTRASEGKIPPDLPAYEPFPNIAPLRGGAGHNRQTAEELAKSAIAYLQRNRQPLSYYNGTVVGLDWDEGVLHPGMTMIVEADVVAQDGTVTEAINTALVVVSMQRSFDRDGTRFFNIKFATDAMPEPTALFKSAKRAFKNKQKQSYPQSPSSSKLYLGVNSGGAGGGGTATGLPVHGITSARHTIVSTPGKVVGATDTDQLGLISFDPTYMSFNNTTNFWEITGLSPTTRLLTAGAGLTGGGDLSADRTIDVGAGAGITVNANDVALTTPGTITPSSTNSSAGNHTHALSGVAASATTITAGAGLTGGGDLSANRTINVGAGAGITVNADDVALTTPGTLSPSSTNTATGNHTHALTGVAASATTITAGAGLTGGGDLSTNRTINVGAGNGITVNADDVALTTPGTLTTSTTNSSVGNHTHALSGVASSATTVTGTGALGGGGDLSANRTITMNTPGTLTASTSNSSSTNHTHAITATADGENNTNTILKSDTNGRLRVAGIGIDAAAEDQAITGLTGYRVGLGAAKGHIQFLDETVDKIKINNGALQLDTGVNLLFVTDGSSEIGSSSTRADVVHTDELDINGITLYNPAGELHVQSAPFKVTNDTLASLTVEGFRGAVTNKSHVRMRGARGSEGSPAALLSGDEIANLEWSGYYASNWGVRNAYIQAAALENFTAGDQGTELRFGNTASGSATAAQRAYLRLGFVVGSPTGGDKGAGTINAQAVYDDNVLLTDFIFDLWQDGQVREEDKGRWGTARLWNIAQTKRYAEEHRHLPTMPGRTEWEASEGKSLGELVTALWQTVEQQQLQIFELQQQIEELKNAPAN